MSNLHPDRVTEFIALVREMRVAQQTFFVTRKNLYPCKKLEQQVDAWLSAEKWGKYPMSNEEAN